MATEGVTHTTRHSSARKEGSEKQMPCRKPRLGRQGCEWRTLALVPAGTNGAARGHYYYTGNGYPIKHTRDRRRILCHHRLIRLH